MEPIQILFQNLLYDLSQLTMALDRVDESFIKSPQEWRAKEIIPFALINGPVSSVFDVVLFAIAGYTAIGSQAIPLNNELIAAGKNASVELSNSAMMAKQQFQAAWFMEGLMTQALVVQVLRSEKVPYFQT
jgi:Mg2+-importing ATPase